MRRRRSARRRARRGRARPRARVGAGADRRDRGRLPLRRPEPRAHRRRHPTTSRPSTSAATGTRGRARPIEVVAVRARARTDAPLAVAELPPVARDARARPGGRRRARLHGVDPRGLGRRARRRSARGCVRRGAVTEQLDPAGAAGADLAAHRRRRGDGRGAAPRRVQPEHQGARRLLGRAVHRRRRAARAGRAHPRAPRLDARGGARRDRRVRRRASRPGDQIVLNDPFAGGTHLNDVTLVAPAFADDGALVGWAANRAHHADLGGMAPGSMPPDATEIYQEGLRIPPVRAARPRSRRSFVAASRTPEERRGDLDAQRRREPARRRHGSRELARRSRSTRSSTTASAGCAPRCARCPTARGEFDDVLDSTGGAERQRARRASRVAVTVAGDDGHVRLHRHRRAAAGHGERGRSGDGQRGRVRAPHRSPIRRSRPTAARCGRCASSRRRARSSPRSPPVAVGAGNVEVSQRVADVCLGALAQAVPDRVGAASQGTMNNVLVGGERRGCTTRRSAAGRVAGPGRAGHERRAHRMTNTRDTPVEAFERAYPMRVRRYALAARAAAARAPRPAATASSASSRCSSRSRCR